MPKIRFQTWCSLREPKSLEDEEREKIRKLRWELDVDPDRFYTLEELQELQEIYKEKNEN